MLKSISRLPPVFHQDSLTINHHPFILLGPVVQRPISANPGLNFNPGFYISQLKSSFGIIYPLLLEHSIIKLYSKRNKLNLLLKLSELISNFTLTLGYLNPTLNNPALGGEKLCESKLFCPGSQHNDPARFQTSTTGVQGTNH